MKNKFSENLIFLSWIIFLFILLGLFSFTSHAEEPYFPMSQNKNEHFSGATSVINEYFDYENNYIFVIYRFQNLSVATDYFYIVSYPKSYGISLFGEINNNGYQFSLYRLGSQELYCYDFGVRWVNGVIPQVNNVQAVSDSVIFGQPFTSSNYDFSKDYYSNFRLYTNNTSSRVLLLNYVDDFNPIVDIGTAIIPGSFIDPIYSSGDTPPVQVPPSYTINNYTWTTNNPPSFDSSSVEAGLESLGDIISYQIGWLSDNLHGEFTTLTGNLKGLFDYVGKTLQYYGNSIISSINNGIQNFYDNMANLVQPIFDKIDYLTQPIDATVIYDNISSTSLVSNISTINSCLNSFQSSFNNVSEPQTFKIPIHLENLPRDYFGIQEVQYIDLGVLGSTEKGLIRTFMWALITYGLFITIVDSISNYINGGGDES